MNIVVDTNVLYYLYGRKKLGMVVNNSKINDSRLKRLIINNDCYITSITLVEIMTYFQNNPTNIRNLFHYIISNNLSIISVGVLDISLDELNHLSNTSNENINFKIKEAIKKKIQIESHFATIMLIIQLEQYYYYYFEKTKLFNQKFKQYSLDLQFSVKETFFEEWINKDLYFRTKNIFRKALKTGYSKQKSNNSKMAEKLLKKAFDEVLKRECINFVFVLGLLIDNNLEFDFNDLLNNWSNFKKMNEPYYQLVEKQVMEYNDLYKLSNKENINKSIRNVIFRFQKQSGLAFYKDYRFNTINETLKPIDCKIPVDYIGKMMDCWTIKGSKYKKNDILDMLILRVLKLDKCVLITFDEMMQNYIHETHHISDKYISRVYRKNN